LEPLGDEVRSPAVGGPMGQVANDPAVAERREDACLALEAGLAVHVIEHLDSDPVARLPIARAINFPHAPRPAEPLDLEPIADPVSWLHLHGYLRRSGRRIDELWARRKATVRLGCTR